MNFNYTLDMLSQGGRTSLFKVSDLSEPTRNFLQRGLVISPWLAGTDLSLRFGPDVMEFLRDVSSAFAALHWTDEVRTQAFQDVPIPDRIARTATYEISASTAVYIAHHELGLTMITVDVARKACERLEQFVNDYGFVPLIQLFTTVTGYENQHALAYYGCIPEKEFVTGVWHRPWIDYSLNDELLFGTYLGNYEMVMKDQLRCVTITEKGKTVLREAEQMLAETGYLDTRIRQIHISRFNLYFDYDTLSNDIWPDFKRLRSEFLNFSKVLPDTTVLELGCADGVFTFGGGLANRVGKGGQLFCADPAAGMIVRAETRRQRLGANWVNFVKAPAENLPFADHTFDTVLGVGFFHFTDAVVALEEIFRVARPGATVASLHPTFFTPWDVPFFYEWFEPILLSAKRRHENTPRSYLKQPDEIVQQFRDAGFVEVEWVNYGFNTHYVDPDKVIENFIFGVGLFQEELATLPFMARQEMIDELKQRGLLVCEKYTEEERILRFPNQIIRAIRP